MATSDAATHTSANGDERRVPMMSRVLGVFAGLCLTAAAAFMGMSLDDVWNEVDVAVAGLPQWQHLAQLTLHGLAVCPGDCVVLGLRLQEIEQSWDDLQCDAIQVNDQSICEHAKGAKVFYAVAYWGLLAAILDTLTAAVCTLLAWGGACLKRHRALSTLAAVCNGLGFVIATGVTVAAWMEGQDASHDIAGVLPAVGLFQTHVVTLSRGPAQAFIGLTLLLAALLLQLVLRWMRSDQAAFEEGRHTQLVPVGAPRSTTQAVSTSQVGCHDWCGVDACNAIMRSHEPVQGQLHSPPCSVCARVTRCTHKSRRLVNGEC